jgi:hypothetical protein
VNQVSGRIRAFFRDFERANNQFQAELLDPCLGDPVVGTDPHGDIQTIGKDEYMAGIAERKSYMESLGFRFVKVVPVEEIPLSHSYSIVKVYGTMRLEETPGRPVDLVHNNAYVVYTGDPSPRIVFSLSHDDPAQMLQDQAPAREPA